MTVAGQEGVPARPLTSANVVRDHGHRAAQRPPLDLEATTIRMRAPGGLDILAYLASGQTVSTADELDTVLERGASEPLQPSWLCSYARARALLAPPSQQGQPGLLPMGVAAHLNPASLLRRHALTYAWVLAAAGDLHALAQQVMAPNLHAEDVAAISAEVARRAAVTKPSRDADLLWLQSLDRFLPHGARQFRVAHGARSRFDDIESMPTRPTGGPLVTVVTPAFRPTRALVTSIRSILAQSWQDLEIIVVDDGSRGIGEVYLDQVEQLDERIRVVRLDRNEGSFRARNVALALARGEFVTGQDADDWSHPERIERQVRPLLRNRRLVATMSRSLRLQEDLSLLYRGYPVTRVNASSLMLRRTAQDRIGVFDSVRKSADSEFQRRIEAVFGSSSLEVVDQVLAFVRLVDSSLSRGDFSPGWHHERRVYYRTMFERWHQRIREGSASPFVGPDPTPRPFPAPRSFDYRPRSPAEVDVVLLGDWRRLGGSQRSTLDEIQALKAAGYTVAVAHKETMRFMVSRQQPLRGPVMELIETGQVTWIQWDDEVGVDHVVIKDPSLMQFADPQPAAWQVRSVWIQADEAPMERDHTGQRYLPSACHARASRWFGLEPLWVPGGPEVRAALEPYVREGWLATFDLPGTIDVELLGWSPPRPLPDRLQEPE
jgi:O-antigen biosynthesis protein